MTEQKQTNKAKQTNKGKQNTNNKKKFSIYWIYVVLFAAIVFLWTSGTKDGKSNVSREVNWEKLQKVINNKDFSQIKVINKEYAEIFIKQEAISRGDTMYNDIFKNDGGIFSSDKLSLDKLNASYVYKFVDYQDFREQLQTIENQWNVQDTLGKDLTELQKQQIIARNRINPTMEKRGGFWSENSGFLISTLFLIVMWIVIFRMMNRGSAMGGGIGGIFSVGKSKAKLYDKDKNTNVTFADVAGLEEAKVEVMEIVDFLKNPDRYTKLGGSWPSRNR